MVEIFNSINFKTVKIELIPDSSLGHMGFDELRRHPKYRSTKNKYCFFTEKSKELFIYYLSTVDFKHICPCEKNLVIDSFRGSNINLQWASFQALEEWNNKGMIKKVRSAFIRSYYLKCAFDELLKKASY